MAEALNGAQQVAQVNPQQRADRNYFKILVILFSFGNEALRDVIKRKLQGLGGRSVEEHIDSEIHNINEGKVQSSLWEKDQKKFKGLQNCDFKDLYNIIWYMVPNFEQSRTNDRLLISVDKLYDLRNDLAHKFPPELNDNDFINTYDELKNIIVDATVTRGDPDAEARKRAQIDALKDADWDSEEVFDVYKEMLVTVGIADEIGKCNQTQKDFMDQICKQVDDALPAKVSPVESTTYIQMAGPNVHLRSWVFRWVPELKSPKSSTRLSFESSNSSLPLWSLEKTGTVEKVPVVRYSSTMLDKLYRNNSKFRECKVYLHEIYKRDPNVDPQRNDIFERMVELGIVQMVGDGEANLDSYMSMFINQEDIPHRIVISAGRGAGKSSLATKMTQDWASNQWDSPLVPLLLKMEKLDYPISIPHALKNQIFKNSALSHKDIYKIIKSHQKEFLLILDGLDENHEYSTEIKQLIAGKWMPKLNVLITTSPVYLDKLIMHLFLKYRINFREEDMINYLESCVQDADKEFLFKEWLAKNKTFSEKLLHEPLLLSYLCGEWVNDKIFHTPSDVCKAMIEQHLHIAEGDNRAVFNFLALCATIYDKNVFIQSDDENNNPNNNEGGIDLEKLTLFPYMEVNSPLFHCQRVIMNDKIYHELIFHSPLIQAYLAYCALISSTDHVKSLLEITQKNFPPLEPVKMLTQFFSAAEGIIPDSNFSTFPNSRYMTFEMRGELYKKIIQFFPERERAIINELNNLTTVTETLAVDKKLGTLAGISAYQPNELVEALEGQDAQNKVILYLGFTENEWTSLCTNTNLISVLVNYLKQCKVDIKTAHGVDVDNIRIASHHTINSIKEMVISFGSTPDSDSKDVTIFWDYQKPWRDVWNKFLTEIQGLTSVSVCPYTMSKQNLEQLFDELPVILTEIDLRGVPLVEINGIQDNVRDMLSKMANLKKLNLAGCRLKPGQIVVLLAALVGRNTLHYLNLQQNNLEKSTETLIKVLECNPRLQLLNIRYCKIGEKDFERILTTIHKNNLDLRHLDIGTNRVSKQACNEILKIFEKCLHLKKLLMNNVRIVTNHMKSLFTVMERNKMKTKITHLDMSNVTNVSGFEDKLFLAFPHLETLCLSNLSISSNGLSKIIGTLQTNHVRLTSLDLSKNFIGSQGVNALFHLDLTRVEHLDLHSCKISYYALNHLFSRFNQGVLKWVDVSDNYIYDEGALAISKMTFVSTVEHLNLKQCRIGPSGVNDLCHTLRKNTTLKFLDLSRNIFAQDEAVVETLGESLHSNLEHLGLASCGFVVKSLETLTAKLPNMRQLKSISLANNSIVDINGQVLNTCLDKVPNLEKFDLMECYLSDETSGLFDKLQEKPLKYLDFRLNPYIYNHGKFIEFLQKTEFLEHFDFKFCQFLKTAQYGMSDEADKKFCLSFARFQEVVKNTAQYLDFSHCEYLNKHYIKISFVPDELRFETQHIKKDQSFATATNDNLLHQHIQPTEMNFVSDIQICGHYGKKDVFELDKKKSKDGQPQIKRLTKKEMKEAEKVKFDNFDGSVYIKSVLMKNLYSIPLHVFEKPIFRHLKFLLFENCEIKNDLLGEFMDLKALQSLGFVNCEVDDGFIEHFLDKYNEFPHLNELRIHRRRITTLLQMKRKLDELKNFDKVRDLNVLDLSGIIVNRNVVTCASKCPDLEELKFQYCRYNPDILFDVLQYVKNLRSLTLNNNEIIAKEEIGNLVTALDQLKKLESFEIRNDFDESYFVDALKECIGRKDLTEEGIEKIKSVELSDEEKTRVKSKRQTERNNLNHERLEQLLKGTFFTNLRCLKISDLDLQDAGATLLAKSFERLPLLEELCVVNCSLLEAGCTVILDNLPSLPKLSTFDFSLNNLNDVKPAAVVVAFRQLIPLRKLILQHLHLKGIAWLGVVRELKHLTELDIRGLKVQGKQIKFSEVEILAKVMNSTPCLSILHITGFYFENEKLGGLQVDTGLIDNFDEKCENILVYPYDLEDETIPIWLSRITASMGKHQLLDTNVPAE